MSRTLRITHLARPEAPGAPGVQGLPALDADAWADVLEAFHATVTAMSAANGSSEGWWYTWLSARDRVNAPLLDDLELLASLDLALDGADGHLELRTPSPAVGRAAAAAARRRGWRVAVPWTTTAAWWRAGLTARAGAARGLARFVGGSLRRIRLAAAHPAAPSGPADVVLVSRLSGRPTEPDAPRRDTYFGLLADELERGGEHPVVLGQLAGPATTAAFEAVTAPGSPPQRTTWHLVRPVDLVRATAATLRERLSVPAGDLPAPVSPALVRRSLHGAAVGRVEGRLLRLALARLLAAEPGARVITTFEGNPWERACDLAAGAASPGRTVVGYAHAPIVASHQKYRRVPSEAGRPRPTVVVCTGPGARDQLLAIGDWPAAEVRPGCALRLPGLRARAPRPAPPAAAGRVLVVLDGTWATSALLAVVAAAAPSRPTGARFVVRAHPDVPLAAVRAAAGIEAWPDGVTVTDVADAEDDIAASDVVVYQGSSLAYVAGYWGIPLVHVVERTRPTGDPLAGCDALKRDVRTPGELAEALTDLGWVGSDFTGAVGSVRAHIDTLYREPDPSGLADLRLEGARP